MNEDKTLKNNPNVETLTDEAIKKDVIVIICKFCKKETCECQFLICPFHGKVNAKKNRDGKFHCTKDDCEITRDSTDLE